MKCYSIRGIGTIVYGIEHTSDNRVEFTVWLSVFYVPLIPLSSWSAFYVAEGFSGPEIEGGYRFADMKRIKPHWNRIFATFAGGLALTSSIVTPIILVIIRTTGRAATPLEMSALFALALCPVIAVSIVEKNKLKKLKASKYSKPYSQNEH